MNVAPAPEPLRRMIQADLHPVAPLPAPAVRALWLVPVALAVIALVPALNSFRLDWYVLGFARAWGLSFAQAALGLGVVSLALRESLPGRSLSNAELVATFAIGLGAPLVVLALTTSVTMLGPSEGHWVRDGLICVRTAAAAVLPALVLADALASRALPVRPVVAGALYGLGAGLISDAGLRLFCEYSQPAHVIVAHGVAIAQAVLAGMALATVTSRLKRAKARPRI